MPVTRDRPGPYAPASAVLELVDRHRNKGLPAPVDAEVLGRAGISDSLIPRTLQALQTLDLIGEDGRPTPILEGLRLAPQADFKTKMEEWLRGAYGDALQYVDPATADEESIRDAFRSYNPIGQQGRMVSLFTGLFKAAGVGPETSNQVPRKATTSSPVNKFKKPNLVKRQPHKSENNGSGGALVGGNLPPALAGLIASLPPQGQGWTKTQRDLFYQAFGSVLDMVYPQREAPVEDVDDEEGE